MNPSFMIVPSMSCQASCKYCFGPHYGDTMDIRTAKMAVQFVHNAALECEMNDITVIFHGGEPLLAPYDVWETLLSGLSDSPNGIPVHFSVQSNLWRLDDHFLDLFSKYKVAIGTSLDGSKEVCDINRGAGYYEKTMTGILKAEEHGQRVGVIATLTTDTLPHAQETLSFFRDNGLNPVIHAAVKGIRDVEDKYSLSPEEYGDGILNLYPWYIKNRKHFSVPTLDNYVKALITGAPHVCTMHDCLGMFLAISPTGDITSCQRFTGNPEYSLGNIFDSPTVASLMESPAAVKLRKRQEEVNKVCSDCSWLGLCHGGCYYNAVSMGDGVIDPLCEGYKMIFSTLQERLISDISSEENINAMSMRPPRDDENPFMRDGQYISLAARMHPSAVAQNSRKIIASYALGHFSDIHSAALYMTDNHYSRDIESTEKALISLKQQIDRRRTNLNNCYIHTTFRCNLMCSHCYASAGETEIEMPLSDIMKLSKEALSLGFRQIVITGGEPLFHRQRDEMTEFFKSLRGLGSNIVLRTNLTGNFSDATLANIAEAFDQVVVSIDGSEETHDKRRGSGTYRNAVSNCERYAMIASEVNRAGELSLACVMSAEEINGAPGQSVRELGKRLNVKRVRFRPLLPLGRAKEMDTPPFCECISQHEPVYDILRTPFSPMKSCGIGQNIYICPDGRSYPCYAWQTDLSYLGNVLTEGLSTVMDSERYTRLRNCTVDTIQKCKDCSLRYLCGGACRAWGNQNETDPDTAPPDCRHMQKRATELLETAIKYIAN